MTDHPPLHAGFIWQVSGTDNAKAWTVHVVTDSCIAAVEVATRANAFDTLEGITVKGVPALYDGPIEGTKP